MDFTELLNDAHKKETDGEVNKAWDIYMQILSSENLRENHGEGYFEFAVFLFRNRCYEEALQMFINAYGLQYKSKEILDIIDDAYYTPNIEDFRLLYDNNIQMLKDFYPDNDYLEFENLPFKLIPSSDEKFYLFDCQNEKFMGTFLKETPNSIDASANQVILIRDEYHIDIIDSYEQATRDNHKEMKWDLPLYLIYDDINMFFALLQINDFREIIQNPRIKMFFNELEVQRYFNKAESHIPNKFINVKTNDSYVYYIRELYTKRMNRFTTQLVNEKLVDVNNDIITIKKNENKKSRIIILQGQSQYDVLRYYSRFLRDAFIQQGHEAVLFDMMVWNQEDYARLVKRFKPDFTVGFNPITYYFSGKTHFEFFNIPHLVILGDAPYYHLYNRALVNPNSPLLGILTNHFVDTFKSMNVSRIYNLKTIGAPASLADSNPVNAYKTIPVVFFGGLSHYNYPKGLPDNYVKVIESFLKDMPNLLALQKKYFTHDLYHIFIDYCRDNKFGEFDKIILNSYVMPYVEKVYRSHCREKAIKDLLDNGVELYLFGNETLKEKFEGFSNAHIHPSVGFQECMEISAQSKFVLNNAPMFFRIHERIPLALLSGSVPVSTPLPNLFADFPELEDVILTYQYGNIDKVALRINELLENEDERIAMVSKGQLLGRKYLSMERYVEEILEAYQKLF